MGHHCNSTNAAVGRLCGSPELWLVVAVLCAVLILCGSWKVLCCIASRCTDGGKKFLPRFRRSLSLKQKDMEDNPIYGNITYTQTRADVPLSSSTSTDHQSPKKQAQPGEQDCYANLKLKTPKPPSARSSPKIQYSDVMTLPRTQEAEVTEGDTDAVSLRSDLYASVDNERNKKLSNDMDYANHI